MTDCLFCKGHHDHKQCPLFADRQTYLADRLPKAFPEDAMKLLGTRETFIKTALASGEKGSSPSLAPTLFEQQFGREQGVLQDVLDHPDLFTHDEVNLAWQILSGVKKIKTLEEEDRILLNHIAEQLAMHPKPVTGRKMSERHPDDDEGPPRDDVYEELVTRGQVDPSDG